MGSGTQVSRQSRGGSHAKVQEIRPRFTARRGRTPLERFAEKCAFDPYTGCVMWIGGRTAGHGHNEPYGRFHDVGEKHLAHRWAAKNIHGHDIHCLQVDHYCPAGPSTLCIEHVRPETAKVNRYLQHVRPGRAFQELATRKYWFFVSKGLEPSPEQTSRFIEVVPMFEPPAWLRPFITVTEYTDDCPF